MSVDIAQLGFRVESLEADLASLRLDNLTEKTGKTETAIDRLAKTAEKTGKAMQRLGKGVSLYLSAPLAALGMVSVRTFAAFDDAMVSSQAIMGDLTDTMRKDMTTAARQMGKETVFSATEAAGAYYFLAAAGLDAAASIAALPKVAAFAQAGNFDMARATDILTDAQAALGMAMEDPIENMQQMVKLSDALVKASTIANASAEQFGVALTTHSGAAMRLLNVEIETGIAVLAAWADQGVKGAAAGERFNIVTRDLQVAIRKNAEVFDEFNISVFDGEGGIRNLADIIENLEDVLLPMSVEMQGSTLALLGFQDRSVAAIRSLLGLSGQIKQYESDLRDAGGATQEVADKQLQSFSKQLGLMKDEIADVAITIGGTLAPTVIEAAGTFRDWLTAFSELDDATQKTLIKIGALTAAAGPLLIIFGSVARAVGTLLPLLARLAPMVSILLGPVGVVAALGGLVAFLGGKYVSGLERAATATRNFTTDLGSLNTASGMQIFLREIQKDIDEFERDKDRLMGMFFEIENQQADRGVLSQVGGKLGILRDDADYDAIKAELLRQMDEIDALIATRVASFENGSGRVAEMLRREKEELEGLNSTLEEVGVTSARVADSGFVALAAAMDEEIAALQGGDAAWDAYLRKQFQITEAAKLGKTALQSEIAAIKEKAGEIYDLNKVVEGSGFAELAASLREETEALLAGKEAWAAYQKAQFIAHATSELGASATDEEIARIQELAGELYNARNAADDLGSSIEKMGRGMQAFGGTAAGAISQMQQGAERGTKEYARMETAIAAANVVAALGAVLNQGNGDPYTAWIRMATMAAALGVSIGGLDGGFTDTAAERQATQGTGTVLGDAEAKSESIVRSMDLTADATSKLVGINRGMLNALNTLNAAITGATGALARGGAASEFSALPKVFQGNAMFDPFGIFGGKSKITDEGVAIMAGTIAELIDGTLFAAYQEVQSKKYIWSSKKTREEVAAVSDEAAKQFGLIFQSLADTVSEGAKVLGISQDLIDERLAAFTVAEQRISLKDLSAEEQQAEIQAVIGAIFDDLAGAVVPYIAQFQKVGEGLGETLIRVATSVQIMQEAVGQLGFAADASDPEAFAIMAVGLVELTGGVSEFIEKFTNYTAKFATDAHKMEVATSALNRAFEQAGLTVPDTADGMWALMQSLDASTESGREHIAMLLDIADTADAYYKMLEEAERDRLNQIDTLNSFIGAGTFAPLGKLRDSYRAAMDAADSLGASQREYALIARSFDAQLKRMAAELTISVINMTRSLFGSGGTVERGFEQTDKVANSVFTEWQNALERIADFTKSILLDEGLTTLTPAQQLAEAQSQFDALLSAAMGGDVGAAADLPAAAKALLDNARFMYASGQDYTEIFERTLAALDSVTVPTNVASTISQSSGRATDGPAQSPQDAIVSELERYMQALDLAGTLRDLSQVLNVSVVELANELAVPLNELVGILGLELGHLSEATAEGLGEIASMLGANVFELAESLGVSIDGLAEVFDVTIENFSAEQFTALAAFSKALGVTVADLSHALGIELGVISDATSLLSQSLDLAIAELPAAIQADLGPMLAAIRQATDEADANAAIGNLGAYINGLPSELSSSLWPFLDAMRYETPAAEMRALNSIAQSTHETATAVWRLFDALNAPVPIGPFQGPVLGSYADGGSIGQTGLYQLHAGEFVVTKDASNMSVKSGDDAATKEELTQIRGILSDIREQNRAYQREDLQVAKEMGSSMKQQAEISRRQANG